MQPIFLKLRELYTKRYLGEPTDGINTNVMLLAKLCSGMILCF